MLHSIFFALASLLLKSFAWQILRLPFAVHCTAEEKHGIGSRGCKETDCGKCCSCMIEP